MAVELGIRSEINGLRPEIACRILDKVSARSESR
jgi:hypothetical protein